MSLWTRRSGPDLDHVGVHILSEGTPFATGQFEYQRIGQQQSLAWTTDSDRRRARHREHYANSETRLPLSCQREPSQEKPRGQRHTRLAGQVDWLRGTSFHARTKSLYRRRLSIPIFPE